MSIFRRSKPAPNPLAEEPIWLIPLHVKAGAEQLPSPFTGAYVQVFCRGETATTAAWAAIQAIEAMGYSVPENPTSANQCRAADYEAVVAANWPGLKGELPSQAEFYERIADHRVVLGPFGAYETPADGS
ncbi:MULTISPECIES: hypothetical protein [unclassified Sphingopyxis]|uniref:hypothetical protein n=1 Tax=unclassified Sphingopyxis TaxID=2614943 RepID=UPI0012E3D32B|nr:MULTISPECIES: hypothetical protein [unclassified Sphingopyxis]